MIAILAAALVEGSTLPSAAPEQSDSATKVYRYWVRDGQALFEVEGHKVGDTVSFDPDAPRNAAQILRVRQSREPSIPPAGVQMERSKVVGYEANGQRGREFVAKAQVLDPSAAAEPKHYRIRVTVYGGTEEDRARVTADLKTHPAFAAYRDALAVQSYAAGHWAVDPALGFPPPGAPTIMVQSTDGYEAWRAEDYSCGPEGLAEAIGSVRRLDPSYRPELTPGPGRPGAGGCPLGFTRDHLPLIAAALALTLWLTLKG